MNAGLQLAASVTCLVTLRREGVGFLLSSPLLSMVHSQGSLWVSQLAPWLEGAIVPCFMGELIEAGKHVGLVVRRCLGFN